MVLRRRARGSSRRDGREWRLGTDAEVAWIAGATRIGLDITSAIPPVFEDYATVVVPDRSRVEPVDNASRVLRVLTETSPDPAWWLGYLDTGNSDVVFPRAPRVRLYADWGYVLVLAGPEQAGSWRFHADVWRPGPDLIFPSDRSWLVSWLWDDDWRCIGGSTGFVNAFLNDTQLETRRVRLGEDATPPGHVAY